MSVILPLEDGSYHDGAIQVRTVIDDIVSESITMEAMIDPYRPIITSITIEGLQYAVKGIGQIHSIIRILNDDNEIGTDVVDSYSNFKVLIDIIEYQDDTLSIEMSDDSFNSSVLFQIPQELIDLEANVMATRVISQSNDDFTIEVFADPGDIVKLRDQTGTQIINPDVNGRWITSSISEENAPFRVIINDVDTGKVTIPPEIWAQYPRNLFIFDLSTLYIRVVVPPDTSIGAAIFVNDWSGGIISKSGYYDGYNPLFGYDVGDFTHNQLYTFSIGVVDRYITRVIEYEFRSVFTAADPGLYPRWDSNGDVIIYLIVSELLPDASYDITTSFDSIISDPPIFDISDLNTTSPGSSTPFNVVLLSVDFNSMADHIALELSNPGTYDINEMTLTIKVDIIQYSVIAGSYTTTFTMPHLNVQVVVD